MAVQETVTESKDNSTRGGGVLHFDEFRDRTDISHLIQYTMEQTCTIQKKHFVGSNLAVIEIATNDIFVHF